MPCGAIKQIKCYWKNKRPALSNEMPRHVTRPQDGAECRITLWREGFVQVEMVGGGHMSLREKALEPIALNNQLAAVA